MTSIETRRPTGVTLQHLCDLPTEIHPILARENWIQSDIRQSEELWDDLGPVLRFVTQMLTDGTALLWWTHLFAGNEEIDKETQSTYLGETSRSWNRKMIPFVADYLSQVTAGRVKFTFSTLAPGVYGITYSNWRDIVKVLEPSISREEKKDIFCKNSMEELVVVALRTEFRDYFTSGIRSLQQDISTSFILAVTIVHELAHAVHNLYTNAFSQEGAELRYGCDDGNKEPCFSLEEAVHPKYFHPRHELGWSLENYLFGLCFEATMVPKYGALNLCHTSTYVLRAEEGSYMPTSHLSVVKFFQRKKWDALRETPRVDMRHCPKAHLQIEHHHGSQKDCRYRLVPNAALSEVSDGLFNLTTAAAAEPILRGSCYIHKAALRFRSFLKDRRSKARQNNSSTIAFVGMSLRNYVKSKRFGQEDYLLDQYPTLSEHYPLSEVARGGPLFTANHQNDSGHQLVPSGQTRRWHTTSSRQTQRQGPAAFPRWPYEYDRIAECGALTPIQTRGSQRVFEQ